jgi:Zn-dependent M28 family amino/carboxypeptidase
MKYLIIISLFFLIGCAENDRTADINPSIEAINAEDLEKHIKMLSSDEFQGRQPSTIGEEKTINYLKSEFEKLGLEPGNGDSFFQEVPLVEIVTQVEPVLTIQGNGKETKLNFRDEFVATSSHVTDEEIKIENAELIFCGYGIVAPEYNWNDYADANIKGKIAVVLVNDPGYATKDSNLFTGNAMTYYGRWTYKYEEAAKQGAAGILIIHETGAASYPWEVVRNGWTGPQFELVSEDKNLSDSKMTGWINTPKAEEIFAQAGLNYQEQIQSAEKPGFKAVPLNLTTSLNLKNTYKESVSNNVLALYPGTDRKDEYVIFTAHWDHFGVDTTLPEGNQIYSGARDNATGTAALLEIAEAFTKLDERPSRSILFLAVTAEEQGLLGSAYYGNNPIYPHNKTVAVINMDALNIFGRMKDMIVVGYGNSELDKYVEAAAKEHNRVVKPDPTPEKGIFYRSDHFSFAKHGVPSIYARGGEDHIEKGAEWGRKTIEDWTAKYYHKPEDKYDPEMWDLAGMVDDVQLLFRAAYMLSIEDTFPEWNEENEFKSIRDASMHDQ